MLFIWPCLIGNVGLSAAIVARFIDVRTQPRYLTVILMLSLALPLSIIYLLPMDLVSTYNDIYNLGLQDSSIYLPASTLSVLWQVNYWLTFLLTWVLLPFLQYWFDSGYYKPQDRFKESIVSLLKFQLIMLCCCIVGLVYMLIHHKDWVTFQFLKGLVITVSHIYALTLALWLMAHGLIAIPRVTYEKVGRLDSRLQKQYLEIPALKEKMDDSKFELTELCAKISTLGSLDPPIEFRDWCLSLINDVPDEFKPSNQRYSYTLASEDPLTSTDITRSRLHDMSLQLHRLKWAYNHNLITFETAVQNAVRLEDEVTSKQLGLLTYRAAANKHQLNPRFQYILEHYLLPLDFGFLTLLGLGLTLVVISSEVFWGSVLSPVLDIAASITKAANGAPDIPVILMPIITYMLFCALVSLSHVKIFDIYHVESNQSSDPVSMTFFVSYACRLTIPLCYNFVMLCDQDFADGSAFYKFLGDSIKLIPLGNFINGLLPRLILVPFLFSYFRVYDKISARLKGNFLFDYFFDEFEFYNDDGTQDTATREVALVREAKQIIQQSLDTATSPAIERRPDLTGETSTQDGLVARVQEFVTGIPDMFKPTTRSLFSGGSGHIHLGGESGASSMSGISLNTNYDSDNSILPDSEIQRME